MKLTLRSKWTKLTLATLAVLTAFSTHAATKPDHYTLANPKDFAVVSDKSQSSAYIFLSYVGEGFNHCGIKIRANGWKDGVTLKDLLIVENANMDASVDLGVLESDGSLAVHESPQSTLFGALYKIKTRSGKSLKAVFTSQKEIQNVDAIVEILGCE